jgi:hypothetical protein
VRTDLVAEVEPAAAVVRAPRLPVVMVRAALPVPRAPRLDALALVPVLISALVAVPRPALVAVFVLVVLVVFGALPVAGGESGRVLSWRRAVGLAAFDDDLPLDDNVASGRVVIHPALGRVVVVVVGSVRDIGVAGAGVLVDRADGGAGDAADDGARGCALAGVTRERPEPEPGERAEEGAAEEPLAGRCTSRRVESQEPGRERADAQPHPSAGRRRPRVSCSCHEGAPSARPLGAVVCAPRPAPGLAAAQGTPDRARPDPFTS